CRQRQALPPAYLRVGNAYVVIENDTLLIESPVDAWLYPGGRYLTVVEPGERVPIVPASTKPVLLAGGVRVSGVSVLRRPYPFWQFDTLRSDLVAENELFYQPIYTYFADTLLEIPVKEGFESPQLQLRLVNAGSATAAPIFRTASAPRRGFWCAEIPLAAYTEFQAETTTPFPFPQSDIWAEISVKGDRNLAVGLTVEDKITGRTFLRENNLLLRPASDKWSTFYIDLSSWVRRHGPNFRFRLYLTSAGDTTGRHTLFLDDVRVITWRRL
ncbi:MAG: hypothetical protein NZ933_08720, partial [Bacteroidia bacterium]|nr:hypothetical protein [Bacteroidia bacterium]